MPNGESVSVTRWLMHPSEMLDWFKAKLQEFYTLPARISRLRVAANTIRERAGAAGRADLAAQAEGIETNLGRTAANHQSVQSRISGWLSELGRVGIKIPGLGETPAPDAQLGVIPIALIIAGGAVAIAVVSIFADYNRQKSVLRSVAEGVMSPADAARIIESGTMFKLDVGGMLKPLVLLGGIGAVVFFWPQLSAAFGGRRRRAA